jgi:hypothetical protein
MTTTAPPENANAAQQRTAPRETRTNENLSHSSRSTAGRKLEIWIRRPVTRGEQLNDWLFGRAQHCAHRGATIESTAEMLRSLVGDQTRPGEIKRQVERAFAFVRGGKATVGDHKPAAKWPDPDDDAVVKFAELRPKTVQDAVDASPHRAPDHPLDVLRELHGADDDALLCLGEKPDGPFFTRTFGEWERRRSEIPRMQMVVPNLMRERRAINFEGNQSMRCRNNSCGFGGQRFVVLELDIKPDAPAAVRLGMAPPDICATLILRAVNLRKLRMVVHSMGKSLHAWIDVRGLSQDDINGFFRTWCRFYGDRRGSLPEQQFRLPQGYRADKAAVQRVLYFNPEGAR